MSTSIPPLATGDHVIDNDPRQPKLEYTVCDLENGRAVLRLNTGITTKVRIDRIHLDGKPRKSGWSRILDVPERANHAGLNQPGGVR